MLNDETMLCSALAETENALLWSMRAWVIGHCRRQDVSGRIVAVMARLGAPSAASCLDRFMGALSRGARRTIEINCVCHPALSQDERNLLDVFALQQKEAHEDAFAILVRLMSESCSVVAIDSAQHLALTLAAVGRILPLRAEGRPHVEDRWHAAASSRYLH